MTKKQTEQPIQVPNTPVEPTPEPTLEPTSEPTPEPTSEPTPEIVTEPTVAEPTPVEPVQETPAPVVNTSVATSISPEIEQWLTEKSVEYDHDIDTLREWYLEEEKGYIDLGLKNDVSEDEFVDLVQGATMSRIQAEMGIPKKELDYFCLGRYNKSPRGGINIVSESVGFIIDPENNNGQPRLTLAQAWNNKIDKHSCVPLGTYKTKFGFNETEAQPDIYGKCNISVEESTNIIETELTWMSQNEKEKLDWIRSIYPVTHLGDAEQNPSMLMVVKDKSYVNPTDIRRIRVVVNQFKDGVNKLGNLWGSYTVTDKTFKPTPTNKFFNVWIDPTIVHNINCGDGSIVEIYGVFKRNFKSNELEMDACAAFPILPKPITNHDQTIMAQNAQALNQSPQVPVVIPTVGGMEG